MSRVTEDLKNIPCGGGSLQKSGGAIHEYNRTDGVPTKKGGSSAPSPPQSGSKVTQTTESTSEYK